MTHICVGKLSIIGSDNGLSPGRRQAIIWTNAGMLLIGPLGTNFSEILIEILTFSFKKMRFKVSSAKWRPFCLGLNVLIPWSRSPLKMAIFFQFVCIPQNFEIFYGSLDQVWGVTLLLLLFNSLRPRGNRRHFADDIFKCIFLNENVWSSIKISLKFVPKGPINNIPALVQIMAWRRPGDKPLSEPMMVNLPTHICVSRPQWVNFISPWTFWQTTTSNAYCWMKMLELRLFHWNFTEICS